MGRLSANFLRAHGYNAELFVECGTNIGSSTLAVAHLFPEVHTIELIPERYETACRRLARFPHVHCHLGNSAEVLPRVLDPSRRTLMWCDAHCETGDQFGTPDPSLLSRELAIILALDWVAGLAILVDDAEKMGKRFWRLRRAGRHQRENWPDGEAIQRQVASYGDAVRVIRRSKGDVWAIERAWR